MHIGFLTPEYPHPEVYYSAGIGTSLKNLVESLVLQGCKVSVFVYNQPKFGYLDEGDIVIHLLQNISSGPAPWLRTRRRINKYVQYYITTEKISLLEVPDWTGISAFMSFSCPVVVRLHGSDGFFCFLENRRQKIKNYYLEKLALIQSDAIISPNHFTYNVTRKVFGLKETKPLGIINLGVDTGVFENPDFDQFEQKTIYYIGTIIRKKGVFLLPSIFEKILELEPEARLVLVGFDAPDVFSKTESTWGLLEKEFKPDVLKQVTYLGKKNYSDILDLLKKANVCVFPSLAETTGMVTLEAMAMGKAVLASNEDWSQEIIENGVNGYRIDPQDSEGFAEMVNRLLKDPQLVYELGERARHKIVSEFDVRTTAANNLQFYTQITDSW